MNRPKTPRLFIGLDAGRETGLAIWSVIEQRFDRLETVTFWKALDIVASYPADQLVVVVEAPAGPTYDHGEPRSLKAARRREKISRNVGSVQRESELLATGLERRGFRVQRVRPRSRKLTAEAFRRLTKHQGRTSQHARDAGMLVFGLRNMPAELDQSAGALSLKLYAPPTR